MRWEARETTMSSSPGEVEVEVEGPWLGILGSLWVAGMVVVP